MLYSKHTNYSSSEAESPSQSSSTINIRQESRGPSATTSSAYMYFNSARLRICFNSVSCAGTISTAFKLPLFRILHQSIPTFTDPYLGSAPASNNISITSFASSSAPCSVLSLAAECNGVSPSIRLTGSTSTPS